MDKIIQICIPFHSLWGFSSVKCYFIVFQSSELGIIMVIMIRMSHEVYIDSNWLIASLSVDFWIRQIFGGFGTDQTNLYFFPIQTCFYVFWTYKTIMNIKNSALWIFYLFFCLAILRNKFHINSVCCPGILLFTKSRQTSTFAFMHNKHINL